MEEKPRSILSNGLYFGMIIGGAMIVVHLLLFVLDLHMNKAVSWINYVVLLGGMVWGTLEFRKKHTNGFLSYGKSFLSCFWIGLFAGIISTVYFFIFMQYIHPGFINEILDQTRASIAESRPEMSEEDVEKAVEMSAKFMSAPFMAFWGLLFYTLFTAVIGLIVSIFLKKEDPSLQS